MESLRFTTCVSSPLEVMNGMLSTLGKKFVFVCLLFYGCLTNDKCGVNKLLKDFTK